jgi:CHASE2 domain-containing sensor protein
MGTRQLRRRLVNVDEVLTAMSRDQARALAVDILLHEPETLGDDVLEACLYILRERLKETAS